MARRDPNAVSTLLQRTNAAPAPAPATPLTMQQLMDAYDNDVRQYRSMSDVDPSQPMSTADIAASVNRSFNDARQDAATGPVGYNRQWVPLIQSLKGKRFVGGGGLPTDTYADPTHSGELTLQPGKPYDVSTPTVTMPPVTMPRVTMPTQGAPPMPEDQDAFETRWNAKDPAAATLTPTTPTTTLKQRATKAQGLPVGQVPAPGPITASPSPPGTPFSLDADGATPLGASPSPPGSPFSLDVLRRMAAGGA